MSRLRITPFGFLRVAPRERWVRVVLIAVERAFQVSYRLARDARRAGERVVFPAGTDALRRFAGVSVATAVPLPVFIIDGPPAIPVG